MSNDEPKFIHDTRRIIAVNAAGCALFRCEECALIDLDMMELIADEDFRGLARLRMALLREHGHAPPIKHPFRRCGGSIFWASVLSRRLADGTFETTVTYEYEE
jgi:PAS domain S-box-containing protein